MADTREPTVSRPGAELVAIWEHDWCARWMVSVASEVDPDNPWRGWLDIDGDAHAGTVEFAGAVLTPAEARKAAEALQRAADHAEQFARARSSFLVELTGPGAFPEIDGLLVEQQRAVREALRAAAERYRKGPEVRHAG